MEFLFVICKYCRPFPIGGCVKIEYGVVVKEVSKICYFYTAVILKDMLRPVRGQLAVSLLTSCI